MFFDTGELAINFSFAGREEGVDMCSVDIGCALGLGEHEVEEDKGLKRIIEWNPNKQNRSS